MHMKFSCRKSWCYLFPCSTRRECNITLYVVEGENRLNGFSFQRGLPIRTSLSDSADIDVFVAYDSSDDGEVLLRRWNTNTKLVE